MLQELFRIPVLDWPIYGYGLMLVLGVFAAIETGRWLANRLGIDGDFFATAGILALVSGVVGARLSHVLENLPAYTVSDLGVAGNLRNMLNLSGGGLTFYGGFLFAAPVIVAYGLWRKMPIRLTMDVVAPCLMIGLAFGRVGCLLNGCCWGGVCDPARVPWAMTFPYASPPYAAHFKAGKINPPPGLTWVVEPEDGRRQVDLLPRGTAERDPALAPLAAASRSLPVHPTQVYSMVTSLLVAGACLALFTVRHAAGQVFGLMLMLEGAGRFSLELLRIEPAVALGLTYSMWIASGLIVAGVAWWLFCGWKWQPPYHQSLDPGPA